MTGFTESTLEHATLAGLEASGSRSTAKAGVRDARRFIARVQR